MNIFSVFHSPGLQLSERINITFTIAGENAMAFFFLSVVQTHAEHVHSICIATFKNVTATFDMFFFCDICLAFLFHVNKVLLDPGILLPPLLCTFEKDSNLLKDFLLVFKPVSCQPVGCSSRWRVWWPYAFILIIRMKLEWTDKIEPAQWNVWFMSWTRPRLCFSLMPCSSCSQIERSLLFISFT